LATYYNLPIAVAPDEQMAPILVGDDDGGAYVVWQDERDERTIYAQHLNELCQPSWKQNGLVVAASSKGQLAPAAVANGKGGVMIFWQDQRHDDGDIYGQLLDGEGHLLWGESGTAVIRANGRQAEPQAVSDGDGGAFVICRDFKSGTEDIVAARIDRNGKILWEEAGKAIAEGKGDQILGDAAATPDGGFVAAWSDNQTGTFRVVTQRYDAKGNAQWLTLPPIVTNRGEQKSPVVHVSSSNTDTRGTTFVVWVDSRNGNRDLYAQKINAAGLSLWGLLDMPICKASNDQHNQQIIGDGSGGIFVVWEDMRSGKGDIYGQRLNSAGQTLWQSDGIGIAVTSHEQTQPRLITDGKEGLICAWADTRGRGNNIWAQRLDQTGKALWADNGIFITDDSGNARRPALLSLASNFLGENGALLAWDDTRHDNEDVFAQPLKGNGAFANVPPRIMSSPVTEAYEARLYTYAIAAIDYDSADPLQLEIVKAPPWLQADKERLKLSGTPSASDVGEELVTITVKDKLGAGAEQSFSLKVFSTNQPPQITSRPDTVILEDQLYSYRIAAVDPDPAEVLTFSMETDATWLKLTEDRKITGTPANEHVRSYAISVQVTDKKGATATQRYSLRVQNVNDAPFFTSRPDTIAFVDSLYSYRASAADVDAGDNVQIDSPAVPSWLTWDARTQTLNGKPLWQHGGTTHDMSLVARDRSGATVVQSFRLRVLSLGAPDTVAPPAPQAVQILPARWSAKKKFTIRWQNPFDPSAISGVFYKIGSPPTHDRDGTLVPSGSDATNAQVDIVAPYEGKVPVYLWLVDGRGNVDFHNTARIFYRHDVTPPAAAQNLSPNRQWSRSDSVRFQWRPASDELSAILHYQFLIDGKSVKYLHGDSNSFVFVGHLEEKIFSWTVIADDSAGNASAPATASFGVDRTSPVLLHTAADTANALADLALSAQAGDALSGIRRVRLHYRAAGEPNYRAKDLQAVAGFASEMANFSTTIEALQVISKGLEYYFETADSAGNLARWPAEPGREYQAIVVTSSNVTAPAPLSAGRYQIFSVPYHLSDGSASALLEDDLGSYDPTVWRLFRYQAGEGKVEFGQPHLEPFAPGRAFWLITTRPQNYDVGATHSLSTNAPFTLVLQPGWNLIATPFDFPTAWPAVYRPEGIENVLWAYDGTRYLSQQQAMMPWQGYFLRNLEAQPKTIIISPVAAQQFSKAATGVAFAEADISWQVRLRVSDGEFYDDENHLGVAVQAAEAWDPFDLSEPPAIGDHVTLQFDRRHWPRYAGVFTSDFRPPAEKVQKWPFTVVASRQGLPVELTWEYSGDLPNDWILVLEDVTGRLRRQIQPEKLEGIATGSYTFRATREPREFIWWAGHKESLAETGALQNIVPAAFELAPSYPNPIRLAATSPQSGHGEAAVIRFGLPAAVGVQLAIFDLAGRRVRTLISGKKLAAGYHETSWDGRDETGHPVAAGIYIYRLDSSAFHASRKLVLLR
jgi:hypothetical protein